MTVIISNHTVAGNAPKTTLQNFSRNLQILLIIDFYMDFSCFQVKKNPTQLF